MAQSDWLTFDLKPSMPEQRESWLRGEFANPPTDPGLIAGDFLPSLMVQAPDPRVLRAVLDRMYSPNDAVTAYAVGCAYRFPDGDIHAQILNEILQKGPSERMAYFVSGRSALFSGDQETIVRAVLPYLHSANNAQVAGALRTLIFLVHPVGVNVPGNSDLAKIADQAVLDAAPDLLHREQKVTFPLAEFLGILKTTTAREFLWQMVDRPGGANSQAVIALTWIASPDDLPRLGDWLAEIGGNDSTGSDRAMLAYGLMHGYGDAAIPYLEKAIANSPHAFVRLQSAEQLAQRGSPVAFRFFLDTVNRNPPYKAEAIRFLEEQFPKELSPSSDDSAVIAFLRTRLGQ
jgi:hypothetical protein